MCVRAIQQQLDENIHSVDEEYKCLHGFLQDRHQDVDDRIAEYHDYYIEKYSLPFVFLPLTQFKDMEAILGPFNLNYPDYNGVKGIWIQMIPCVTIKGSQSTHVEVPIMTIGTNKTDLYFVDLDGDQSYVRKYWANKLIRIKACVAQRDMVASACLPTPDDIEYTQNEMNKIINSKDIVTTHLIQVAQNFLNGIGPFIQADYILRRDDAFLKELSSIEQCRLAKSVISHYTNNLKNKLQKSNILRPSWYFENMHRDNDDRDLVDETMDIDLTFLSDYECDSRSYEAYGSYDSREYY